MVSVKPGFTVALFNKVLAWRVAGCTRGGKNLTPFIDEFLFFWRWSEFLHKSISFVTCVDGVLNSEKSLF